MPGISDETVYAKDLDPKYVASMVRHRVLNLRTGIGHVPEPPAGQRYIGRHPNLVIGKWGNPDVLRTDDLAGRVYSLKAYCLHLLKTSLWKSLDELIGKDLVCWCSPKLCHGHLLVHLIQRGCDETYLRYLSLLSDDEFVRAIGFNRR